jgi:hypothetical protein
MAQEPQKQEQNVSPAQMLELIKEFAKELKKPDAETQAELDAKKARLEANRKQAIAEAEQETRRKEVEQAVCSHMKGHPYVGKSYISAMLHNDGLHHAFCFHCGKQFGVFAPGQDTIPMGMTISDFSGITPEIIKLWCDRYAKAKAS